MTRQRQVVIRHAFQNAVSLENLPSGILVPCFIWLRYINDELVWITHLSLTRPPYRNKFLRILGSAITQMQIHEIERL
jgi:hypothetical protein